MAKSKVFFTGFLGPGINLLLAISLVVAAWRYAGIVVGFPSWAFWLMALIFLIMIPGALRCLVLGEKGLALLTWRMRVEMDYDEITRIEVIPRRVNPLAPWVVHYVALRSEDDRIGWLASWNFVFSRRLFVALAERFREKRGNPIEVRQVETEASPVRRFYPFILLGSAMIVAGLYVLGQVGEEGLRRAETKEIGLQGQAKIYSLQRKEGTDEWQVALIYSGVTRRLLARSGWAQGREVGDQAAILVHPKWRSVFILADQGSAVWSAFGPTFLALVLIVFGGRLLVRSAGTPVGIPDRLRQALEQSEIV